MGGSDEEIENKQTSPTRAKIHDIQYILTSYKCKALYLPKRVQVLGVLREGKRRLEGAVS